MNHIKTFTSVGAAMVLAVGLSASSTASAHNSGYGHYYHGKKCHYGHYWKYGHGDYGYHCHYKKHHGGYHGGYHGGHHGGHHGGYDGHDDGHHDGHHNGDHYGNSYSDLGIKDLRFYDLGGRLEAEATVTGLDGDESVRIDLEATSDVRSSCQVAAGRSVETLDVQNRGSRLVAWSVPMSREFDVNIETDDSDDLARELVSCPDLQVEQVGFLDARIDVTQGDNVLTLLCTFKTPTVDGEVAPEIVECSSF